MSKDSLVQYSGVCLGALDYDLFTKEVNLYATKIEGNDEKSCTLKHLKITFKKVVNLEVKDPTGEEVENQEVSEFFLTANSDDTVRVEITFSTDDTKIIIDFDDFDIVTEHEGPYIGP